MKVSIVVTHLLGHRSSGRALTLAAALYGRGRRCAGRSGVGMPCPTVRGRDGVDYGPIAAGLRWANPTGVRFFARIVGCLCWMRGGDVNRPRSAKVMTGTSAEMLG